MSFKRSYSIESHERIKLILIFGEKSLLLTWWVTYFGNSNLQTNFMVRPMTVKQVQALLCLIKHVLCVLEGE